MKNFKLSLAGVFTLAMLFFTGCDDPCKDVTCLNAGTCLEGICECAEGYEGTDCANANNAKFVGSFLKGSETCDSTVLGSYTIVNTASGTDAKAFTLGGIYDNGATNTVNVTVDTDTQKFTIASQSFTDDVLGSGFELSGSGSVSEDGNTITLTYQLLDQNNAGAMWDNCSGTFIK